MRDNKGLEILEKIKNGAVLELVDYSDIKLKNSEKELIDCVIKYHRKEPPRLPRIKELKKSTDMYENHIRIASSKLIRNGFLCKFDFKQIWKEYGYYKNHLPRLPRNIDLATWEELRELRHHNFKKKMSRDSSSYWHDYYLALITEADVYGRKVPVFQRIFDVPVLKPVSV